MRKHQRTRVRPDEATSKHPRAVEQQPSPPQHPLVALQGIIGNRAVQRLMVQREESGEKLSSEERAERYIREKIKQYDKYITRDFESIGNALLPEERQRKLPLIESYKTFHLATGIMTVDMVATLHSALLPVKGADYVDDIFRRLRQDVRYKDEMIEALDDDPFEWYMKHMDKLTRH